MDHEDGKDMDSGDVREYAPTGEEIQEAKNDTMTVPHEVIGLSINKKWLLFAPGVNILG